MSKKLRTALRRFALDFPGAVEEFPWGGSVIKVNKKIFVFLGDDEHQAITVKLPDSHEQALALECASPTGYGLGRAGWVSIQLGEPDQPSQGVLEDWIEESYRAVALKRLVKELDARA